MVLLSGTDGKIRSSVHPENTQGTQENLMRNRDVPREVFISCFPSTNKFRTVVLKKKKKQECHLLTAAANN